MENINNLSHKSILFHLFQYLMNILLKYNAAFVKGCTLSTYKSYLHVNESIAWDRSLLKEHEEQMSILKDWKLG